MFKNIHILLTAFCLLAFPVPIFAGGFHSGPNHFGMSNHAFSRHKSNHTRYTGRSFSKYKLTSHEKWHHKIKGVNKIKFPYYVYPNYYSNGSDNLKDDENVLVNINITDRNKEEKIESSVIQKTSFSPPHVVSLEDIAPQKSTENIKTSNKPEYVILIHGTDVIHLPLPVHIW